MKIGMLGWEYPPRISGGLGVASQGLAQALDGVGHSVTFFLPSVAGKIRDGNITFIDASKIKLDPSRHTKIEEITEEFSDLNITEMLLPYLPPVYFRSTRKKRRKAKKISIDEGVKLLENVKITGNYTDAIHHETKKYALVVTDHLSDNPVDIIHAHDWMTFPAGRLAAEKTGKPFVAHVHSTEIDRNGSFADPRIMAIEKEGLLHADLIFTVSSSVARRLQDHYGITEQKISVIPNGFTEGGITKSRKSGTQLKVGFLGRFADQKGPGKFLDISRELLNKIPNLKFSMAGDGYLLESVKNKIDQLNLQRNVALKGFIKPHQVPGWLSGISVLVVPSISEPFGLVALEAIQTGVPVVISRGAGICEFVPHLRQVDHWDIYNFTSSVQELIEDSELSEKYVKACQKQANELSWRKAARDVTRVYKEAVT